MHFNLHFSGSVLTIVAALLTAQTVLADTTTSTVDKSRQNELLYFVRHDCGSCHGMTLKGGLGPALLPETLSAKPKEFLVTTILEGRENTAMPPWKPMLSRDDVLWIVEQLQSGHMAPTKLAKGAQ